MWNKGDWVIVIDRSFGKQMIVKDVIFKIAQITEIGVDDLFVQPKKKDSSWIENPFFVPKSMCQQIPIQTIDVYETTRKPKVGDLVFYYFKNYTGEVTQVVSHVLEIKSRSGKYPEALITVSEELSWVNVDNLLVLSVNNSIL
tara:strand:+ start:65 stop:493 length:429 start_codon:yes stop_codon:yes gene_type:complete